MKKEVVDNPRYPHLIKITRRGDAVESNDPFKRAEGGSTETVIYEGEGRSYTDTTTNGSTAVDVNKRKASIPVRFDEWPPSSDGDVSWPMDGDIIEVVKASITERGKVRDFEPDNNRTVVYWELTRQ